MEERGNIQFIAKLEREEMEKEGEKILHPKVKLNSKRHLIVGSKLEKKIMEEEKREEKKQTEQRYPLLGRDL